jgi:hypothetical protein
MNTDIDFYKEMKQLDSWTIYEGIMLMVKPEWAQYEAQYRIYADEHLLPFPRAFEEKSLKARPPDYCCDKFSSSGMSPNWEMNIGYFKINPFEFLMFVKERGMFVIPSELQWVEKKNPSGGIKYYWASNVPEDPPPNNTQRESFENDDLTGKEKQELGRLRAEKAKMDATVLAAIDVGRFIQKKEDQGKLIVRKDIDDCVYRLDKNIPQTRIDMIWKSIPVSCKKGPGRPKTKSTDIQ